MGIDYGRVRVGLALSDPLGITAQPLAVLESKSPEVLLTDLGRIVSEREVTHVVLGLPLKLDGTEGSAASEARTFAEELRRRLDVPVELWDERLSTVQAERAMLDADMSRTQRKKRRDKVAAQILLQSYLDAHR
ncbi:MAG: hypothetical protein AMS16_03505 [Planctomycetes bacterium DG_58]|nr:MAG: hypothetical protein AMS16_03505 [Planctomycetes bacterium DG_58]KPL02450.1 MAG: hypothetical protein AMK75_02770 [Planctomycetes bacterium SM23_65]